MRKFTYFATIIALLTNAMLVAEAQGQGRSNTNFNDMRYSIEFGAKAYDRPGDDTGIPLITDSITNRTLFDSDQATDLGSAGGAEVKFNFVNRLGTEYEVRTIIAQWDQTSTIEGSGLQSPFFTDPLFAPTTVGYQYEADFFSFEIMRRRAVAPGLTLMFGPRVVSSKDLIRQSGSLTADAGDGTGPVTVTETQTFEATNILIGLQGGFELNIPIAQSMYINSFARIGGYTNPSEVNTGTFNDFTGARTSQRLSKSTGSALLEVGGRLYVDIFPNALSAYVGYEATWIDGIALAPAQVITTGITEVETANTPFFNAATLGLRWTY